MKYRKAIALGLALALSLSNMTSLASAKQGTHEKEGDALYRLGLLQGYSDTKKELGLSDILVREASMKLIVKILGWEIDDNKSIYEDVSLWAQPYVAKAKAKGITNGISPDQFGGKQSATFHQVVTWYLRALGFDQQEAWTNAAELGVSQGLIEATDLPDFDRVATRDDLVAVAFQALKTNIKDQDITVVEKLIADGKVKEETALEVGLIDESSQGIDVLSLEPTYLVETTVRFNQPVDKESLKDAKIKVGNMVIGEKDLELTQGDKVLLIKHNAVANTKDQVVSISGIKGTNGSQLKKVEKTLRYVDTTPLDVDTVEVIGSQSILVNFTEPVKDFGKSQFTLKDEDGKSIIIRSVEAYRATDKANAKLKINTYGQLEKKEYTLTIKTGVRDYAGLGAYRVVKVTPDVKTEAPVILSTEVKSRNKIEFTFNRPIMLNKTESSFINKVNDLLYHTNSNNYASGVKIDGEKLIVTFAKDYELPTGTAYVYFGDELIKDLWGNKTKAFRQEIQIEVDKQAPTIKEVKQGGSQKEIDVIFKDEDLNGESLKEKKNYGIQDEKGNAIRISRVTVSHKKATLFVKEDLDGLYNVTVKDIADTTGNKMAEAKFEIKVQDRTDKSFAGTKVFLYNSGKDEQLLVVDFGFKVTTSGKLSALDLSKYLLLNKSTGKTLDLEGKDVDIVLAPNEKGVEITIPKEVMDLANYQQYQLQIGRIGDIYGNKVGELSGDKGLMDLTNVTMSLIEIKAVEEDQLKMIFKGIVEYFDLDDFVIHIDGVNYHAFEEVSRKVTDKGQTELVVRVNGKLPHYVGEKNVIVRTEGKVFSGNHYGQTITPNASRSDLKDGVKPVFNKEATKKSAYGPSQLIFKENLQYNSELGVTDLGVTYEGKTLVPGIDFMVYNMKDLLPKGKGDNRSLYIMFKGDYAKLNSDTDGEYTISVKNAHYIMDQAGNTLADFEYTFNRDAAAERKMSQEASTELTRLQGEVTKAQEAKEAAQQAYNEKKAVVSEVKQQLANKESELVKNQTKLNLLKDTIEANKKQKADKTKELETLTATYESEKVEMQKNINAYHAKGRELDKLGDNKSYSYQNARDNAQTFWYYKNQAKQQVDRLAAISNRNEQQEKEYQDNLAKYQDYTNKEQDAIKRRDDALKASEKAYADAKIEKEKGNDLQRKLNAKKAEFESASERIGKLIKEIEASLARNTSEAQGIEGKITTIQGEITTLKGKVKVAEAEATKAQEVLGEKTKAYETAQLLYASYQRRYNTIFIEGDFFFNEL